jgi:threonine/homoserine/homoserine lactone efflux protein
VLVGVSVAAPLGPMALLCITRTIAHGWVVGLVSGLAAASVDLLYASVGAFGVAELTDMIDRNGAWLRALGSAYLLYFAIVTFRSTPQPPNCQTKSESSVSIFISTFALNLTNPMTIMPFVAIFAGTGLGVGDGRNYTNLVAAALGVFVGATLWWLVLSLICDSMRDRIQIGWLRALNRLSALGLGALAFRSFYSLFIPR